MRAQDNIEIPICDLRRQTLSAMSALCFASSTIVNPLSTQNLTLKRDLRHANRKCSFRCNSQMHMSSPKGCLSRRAFVHLSLSLSLLPLPARAYNPFAEQQDLISHLEHAIPHPPISKIFQRDLYFPPSFQGTWDTYSTLLSVACPAGYKLFGRQGSFESAQKVRLSFSLLASHILTFFIASGRDARLPNAIRHKQWTCYMRQSLQP